MYLVKEDTVSWVRVFVVLALVMLAVLAWMMVDVRLVRRGQLPTVEIHAGMAPKFEIELGRINVGSDTKTVDLPTVDLDVDLPTLGGDQQVTVPTVTLDRPADR